MTDLDRLAGELRRRHETSAHYYHGRPLSADELLAEMKMAEIDMALTWQNPAATLYTGDREANYAALLAANRHIDTVVRRHPERFIPGGWTDPRALGLGLALELVDVLVLELGFLFVKMNPAQNQYPIDSDEVQAVVDRIVGQGGFRRFTLARTRTSRRRIREQIYDVKVNAVIPWATIQRTGTWIGGDPNPGTAFNVDDKGNVTIRPGYYFFKQVSRAGQPGMAVCAVSSGHESIRLIAFGRNGRRHADAFVVINLGNEARSVSARVRGTGAKAFRAIRSTNDGAHLFADAGIFAAKAGTLVFEMPPGSVATFLEWHGAPLP